MTGGKRDGEMGRRKGSGRKVKLKLSQRARQEEKRTQESIREGRRKTSVYTEVTLLELLGLPYRVERSVERARSVASFLQLIVLSLRRPQHHLHRILTKTTESKNLRRSFRSWGDDSLSSKGISAEQKREKAREGERRGELGATAKREAGAAACCSSS